jgi:hypothetical protein
VLTLRRPAGKLKLTIKATWLKDAKVDGDALTEMSFGTQRSTEAGEAFEEGDEQVGGACCRASGVAVGWLTPASGLMSGVRL